MIYGLAIGIHVLACIILIAVILLQAGRGGGLSETFGGESGQTIFGTKATTFFSRATIVAATVFILTSLLLGIMTSRRGRSLINLEKIIAETNFTPKNEVETTENKEELPLAEKVAEPEETSK